jgi:hypothetical protein
VLQNYTTDAHEMDNETTVEPGVWWFAPVRYRYLTQLGSL